MATNALGTVACHQADNECAEDWHENYERSEMVPGGRNQIGRPPLIEKEIGKKADQSQQGESDESADDPDYDCNCR